MNFKKKRKLIKSLYVLFDGRENVFNAFKSAMKSSKSYKAKEITKIIYNNIMNSIKL